MSELLVAPLELRVGLTERECRAWIEALRQAGDFQRVADELERAVDAALAAGITNQHSPSRPNPGAAK